MGPLAAVDFAIPGSLEGRDDGRLLTLRQGRPRAPLTALLLRLGKVGSADALVEEVCGQQMLADAGEPGPITRPIEEESFDDRGTQGVHRGGLSGR